ncbi:branched-chain amino acid ABC transporter permease [Rhizobium sp.]
MLDLLPQHLINGLALGSTYALVAMGLTLVFGVLLIPNFAHGELYMFGGFISYTLVALGLNFWLAIVIAALVTGVIGILLDFVVFKPMDKAPGLSLMIAALGGSMVMQQVATFIWSTEPRTTPNPLPGGFRTSFFAITYYQIVIMVTLLIVWAGLTLVLNRSKIGSAIRAVAQNEDAAKLMGISMPQVRITTFAIGALIGGLAGALLGATFPIYPSVGVLPVLKAFVVLVLGGIGSLPGAIVGGLLLGVIEVLIAGYISSTLQDTGAFLILVVFLLLRPQGLFGKAPIER